MNAVETALYSTLSAGTALISLLGGTAIYNGMIPRDADLPCVVFSHASGIEENLTPTRSSRMIYLVKGVADTMYEAGQIADAVDTLLHGTTITPTGYSNFWTAREMHVRYVETDPGGQIVAHSGGEYAIRIEKT